MANDFIEEMQTEAKLRFGKELSPSEVANEFTKHDFEARIEHLKNLKTADSFVTQGKLQSATYSSALFAARTNICER